MAGTFARWSAIYALPGGLILEMPALVSVVIPCFNYGRYLASCVRSLYDQTLRDWECIVVDDGSTDETPEVCAKLAAADSRVTYVRQENRGVSAARNVGIDRATGDFIQLLDADDLLEPDKLSMQVRYLEANGDTDIVFGEAAFFDADSRRALRTRRRLGAAGATIYVEGKGTPVASALVSGNIGVIHAALVRRRVFRAVGPFDETLSLNEDWEFWFRCALGGCRFGHVVGGHDRALVREHGPSPSRLREPMLRASIAVRERINPQLSESLRVKNLELLLRTKARLGMELIRQGKKPQGWALYREAYRSTSRKPLLLLELLRLVPGAEPISKFSRTALSGIRLR